MSLTAQNIVAMKGLTNEKIEAVIKEVNYISELSDLGLTEGEVTNSLYLPKKTINEVSLTVRDGGAKIVGLEDTMIQQANAILEQQTISLVPFAIQLEENMIIAPEYRMAEKLAPEMLSFLAQQKDSISWNLLKNTATSIDKITVTAQNFANAVMSVMDTMKMNLNTNQGNWLMLISDNIVRKLYTTFNDSGLNVGKQIFESLAANNILLKRHTQEDNMVIIMDRKLCKHYRGDAVSGRAPYTRNQESITASTVHEFYFTSDYFTKPKSKSYAMVSVACEITDDSTNPVDPSDPASVSVDNKTLQGQVKSQASKIADLEKTLKDLKKQIKV